MKAKENKPSKIQNYFIQMVDFMENTFGEKWTLNFLQSGQQQVCFVYDFIISFYKMLLINFIISLLILHTPAILYLSPKPFELKVYLSHSKRTSFLGGPNYV